MNGFKHRGISLAELLVSLGIFSILMVGAVGIFREGMDLYRTNEAAADAQLSTLRVQGSLAADFMNGQGGLMKLYPGATATDPSAVVLASSVARGGDVKFSSAGAVSWRRYICYRFVPDPKASSGGHDGKLWWSSVPVADGSGMGVGDGNPDVGVVKAWIDSIAHDPNYFATQPGIERRVIGDQLASFKITQVLTGGFGGPNPKKVGYDIEIGCGDKQKALRNGYFIKVTTRVVLE